MVEAVLKNWENKEVGKLKLSADVFSQENRSDILHRVVQWQLAKRRLGCHKTKERNEVSGSTRKIYRQKGTGGARHGSIKAPIFVGGGTAFGPQVRDHSHSLNKKIRLLGLKVALSLKCAQKSVIFLDSAKLDSYKTSALQGKLNDLGVKSALIVDADLDQNLISAAGNIHNIDVLPVVGLNVYDILKHETVIVTKEAVEAIEKRLAC